MVYNKEEGGWEGEREDDPVAAAEEPRVNSWDVLDMSSLDLIPKLLAAFTEIRLQPEPIVDQLYDIVPTLKNILDCPSSLRVVSPGNRH